MPPKMAHPLTSRGGRSGPCLVASPCGGHLALHFASTVHVFATQRRPSKAGS